MDRNRLVELALNELLRQGAGIEEEIAALVSELGGTAAPVPQTKSVRSAGTGRGRKRTDAEKKAHSILMKKIWAARKAKAAKPAAQPSKAVKPANATKAASGYRVQVKKNARSLAMIAAWKKRKAAAAGVIDHPKAYFSEHLPVEQGLNIIAEALPRLFMHAF
jgi:hypothetical protein